MVASRSPLERSEIVARLERLLTPEQIVTDEQELREASVDRFKKYTAVHGIFDGPIPAAIVLARSTEDVARVLAFADEHLINVVPRTGRTATEGGLETIVDDTIVLDGSQMDAILDIDPVNMTATAQCGVPLQRLEDELRAQGLTTGHSPQSKPIAQMGGLVATRSIGQFSTLYGGIEDLTMGLEAVFPGGAVRRIKNVPRRAAGPDIRHIVIGNEGALCFITEVTVKIFRHQPEHLRFLGFLVDSLPAGVEGLREIIVEGYRPSVARAYSEEDAAQHFAHFAGGRAVVVVVAEGPQAIADATAEGVERIFAGIPHEPVEPALVEAWFDGLNWGQDKIDAEKRTMLETAHLGYTTEVSIGWSGVGELFESVMHRVRTEFPREADLTMLGAHSSHSYQTGTNLYFVYDYRIDCEPREEIAEYHVPLNAIIVEEALRLGGSMVHHHGIGKYRTPWTLEEHGTAYPLLAGLKRQFDPNGIMNLGTVFPDRVGPGVGSGPCVIAIDGGSQSTKVSVFDARGVLRASAQRALRPYASPGPGRWEHPDDDLWDSLAATVRAVLTAFADAGGDAAEIVGVGLCTIRFCRAVLREDGSLAQPVMSWMDERLSRPHSAAESPVDARYLTTSSGYLGFRLTGERRDTAGNAQGVWPVDPERWTWSADPEAFVRTGMPREMLFDLVAPGTILGGVTAAAAAATGLPEGLPVVATSNDKAVEALGAGLREPDRALISLGTYVSGMTLSERAEPPLSEAWVNFGAEPGSYLVECAGVRRGMWTVSWFRELLGAGREPGAAPSEAELGREAESVPPGSGGLIVSLDWLAPSDAPERRGAIVGFDGTQGRGHVFRAILEALAVTVGGSCRALVEAQGRELREVVVTGGGAASELMLRILAAVFERPVRRPGIADAAGVGAAVSAAVAIGLHRDWDVAVAAMVRPGLLVEPEPELVEAYRAVRADYERVIPRVRELFA